MKMWIAINLILWNSSYFQAFEGHPKISFYTNGNNSYFIIHPGAYFPKVHVYVPGGILF